jgi:predicted nuclease of predicted toxin-antitoxin system
LFKICCGSRISFIGGQSLKLLFDQNLSPSLVELLSDIFPNSVHVQTIGLERAFDHEVWEYARNENYTIVTKDTDFHERSVLYGSPPKIIWLRRGNCSTKAIELILRKHHADVHTLFTSDPIDFLMLF